MEKAPASGYNGYESDNERTYVGHNGKKTSGETPVRSGVCLPGGVQRFGPAVVERGVDVPSKRNSATPV